MKSNKITKQGYYWYRDKSHDWFNKWAICKVVYTKNKYKREWTVAFFDLVTEFKLLELEGDFVGPLSWTDRSFLFYLGKRIYCRLKSFITVRDA